MRIKGWIVVLLCAGVCASQVIYSKYNQRKVVEKAKNKILEANNELNIKLLVHLKYANNFKIKETLVVENSNGIQQKLKDISTRRPVLIFKIAEHHCSSCIESAIDNLSDYIDKLSKKMDIAILISTHGTSNSLRVIENSYQNKFRFYAINENEFRNNEIEKLDLPYFFIADNGEYRGYLFIPDKNRTELTSQYFKLIENEI